MISTTPPDWMGTLTADDGWIMFREDASKVKNGGCLYASYTGKHFLISDMSVWRYVEVFIMKAQYSARKLALTDITIISSLY